MPTSLWVARLQKINARTLNMQRTLNIAPLAPLLAFRAAIPQPGRGAKSLGFTTRVALAPNNMPDAQEFRVSTLCVGF